ncbi:MAG TPA: hypothetical protein VGQ18_16095 [Gemmatimonadales bacterium]|nr:hypothetical protein [Gemmatimonadales bacterium]
MKPRAVAAALVALLTLAAWLAAPPRAAAQDSSAVTLQRARGYYNDLDLERALPLLRQVVSPQWPYDVTPGQRVEAYKYLAAALVLVGERDSAVTYFAAALARDPFTDLDPQEFTPAQRLAFAAARPRVFAVAARPVADARADVRSDRIHFVVATTHRAALQVLLHPMEEGATAFPIFRGDNEGEREIAWDGLTPDGRLAATGRYALLVVGASRLLDRTDSARVYFLVAREAPTLEDTLPDFPRSALLPERAGSSRATRELAKGIIIAGGALLVSSAVVNRELGGGGRGGASVVAGLGVLAGAAGFLTLSRRHDIPENIQANLQRQAERRAANQAIRQRNADRLAQAVLIVSPAAGVGP